MAGQLDPRKWGRGQWLVAAAVVLAVVTVCVQSRKPPNLLAASILQAAALVFSIYGSYVLGQVSAREAAREMIKPHAASAFRRMLNLYQGLGRLKKAIATSGADLNGLREPDAAQYIVYSHVAWALALLDAMVTEQVATGEDAVNDWRDLAPEEVARVERLATRGAESLEGASNDG